MSDRRPTMQEEADAQLKRIRENMREAPERITATFNNWRNPNAGACYKNDAGDTEYIRRDPAVLAALPEVQTQIDAAVKAALMNAADMLDKRHRGDLPAHIPSESGNWVRDLLRKGEQP